MFGNLFSGTKKTDPQIPGDIQTPAIPDPSQIAAIPAQPSVIDQTAVPVAPAPVPEPIQILQPPVTVDPVPTPVPAVEAPPLPSSVPPAELIMPPAPIAPPVPMQQEPTNIPVPQVAAPAAPIAPVVDTANTGMDSAQREYLSALSHLDSRATQVVAYAQQETVRTQQSIIMPQHILLGLLYDTEIAKLLQNFSVDTAKLIQELQAKETTGNFSGQPTLSEEVKQIFETAFTAAKDRTSSFIAPEDLLVSIFSSPIAAELQAEGVNKDDVMAKLSKSAAFTEGRKSVLEKFGIDLTAKAQAGSLDPVAGRANEVDRLEHILLRRTKNNPIIIGEAGVGKTAIVEGLAQAIVSGNVPAELKNKKIIQIDVSSLVAGASHRGEFEERLRSVMRDAMSSSGQVILFIDEIHTLIGTGDNEGGLDASNIIKPNLARGELQIIGTTTTAEYRKYFEKDKAFARRFQPITAEEPDEATAVKMLQVLKAKYETYHHVTIPDEALQAAVKLSKKYIGERYLPDKAVDLLDEGAADVKLQHSAGKRQDTTLTRGDIEKVVSSWTGIPITKLTEDESQKLLELEKRIHQRLIDQDQAVSAVAEAVRRGRIGLAAANRPIASFIFLGPTGTGKTELAKTLAEILFGRDDAMVRLDMSEYMEKHEVAKLIGAPPGYVGYEEGGQLTEAVRAKPYSIVLLDEVEKAHPDVFNILLQLLEDGRLTDNKGNTISFKNTIVIATSNIGSQDIQEQLSKPTQTPEEFEKMYKEMQAKVSEDLHKFFRPELLNRFDEIAMFKPLRKEDMKYIAKLGIEKTAKLLKEQGFILQISDPALEVLANEGYDAQYGARPLRRLIQTAIENPIAMMIIQKAFVLGDTIQINYDQQKMAFTFIKLAPVTAVTTNQPQNDAGVMTSPVPPVQMPTAQSVAPMTTVEQATTYTTPQISPATPQMNAPQVPQMNPSPAPMPTTLPVQTTGGYAVNTDPLVSQSSTSMPTPPVAINTTQNPGFTEPAAAPVADKIMQTTADIAAAQQILTPQAIDARLATTQPLQSQMSQAAVTNIASATELPVDAVTMGNVNVQASIVDQLSNTPPPFVANGNNFAQPAVASAALVANEENKGQFT